MEVSKLTSRIPIYPLFIAVSLLVGWFIPGFYAWTDSDQSRPSPLLWHVPLASAIAATAFCVALPWLPIQARPANTDRDAAVRFSIRTLLMLTGGFAVTLALLVKFPVIASGLVCAAAYAYFIAFVIRQPQHRLPAFALLASMTLPYAWVVGYDELDRILPQLALMFAGMPAFVPAVLVDKWASQLIGQNMHESQWLMFLLTASELAIGTWMIRLGPKRTIAYLLLVMHVSGLGSLAFYMMCIA